MEVSYISRSRAQPEPLWELIDLRKVFPGVVANDGISLRILPGEIHGLVGENGSGKSTLVKILSGAVQPDSGDLVHRGHHTILRSPVDARRQGVATVFQEFSVVSKLSVTENIHLGRWPHRRGRIDWAAMRARASQTLESLGLSIDPDALVGALSVGKQQLVEITKAISLDADLIILDEPTTALGQSEIKSLHAVVRRLKRQGRAILYISHRLDELLEIADVVTVLKNGRVVSDAASSQREVNYLVRAMVGSELREHFPKERNARSDVLLEAKGIATANRVRNTSISLRSGEVLGLAGLLGSGRTEIARALFGIDRIVAGSIAIRGRPTTLFSPRDAIRAKIAYLPENRKSDGLFFNFTATENITAAGLRALVRRGLLNLRAERRIVGELIEKMQISPQAISKGVGLLSGGNQQKVIIARWVHSGAEVFLLDEPTQGIDIGARRAVYELINEITRSGKAVVLISSDQDELLSMSDRIAIVKAGSIRDVVKAEDFDKGALARALLQVN